MDWEGRGWREGHSLMVIVANIYWWHCGQILVSHYLHLQMRRVMLRWLKHRPVGNGV